MGAAEQGHADGTNNFGFCLEHGRGVQQNFKMAADYHKFAADRGHLEAKINHPRCFRFLGRWKPSDRSSDSVCNPPSLDRLPELFPPFLQHPAPLLQDDDEWPLVSAFKRLKKPVISEPRDLVWLPDEIVSGDSSVMKLTIDPKSNLVAVKTAKSADCPELIWLQATVLETLKHPLVLELRDPISKGHDGRASIVTAYAG
jgi:hypothetical protein